MKKKPTLEERINEVTMQLKFFEEENRANPDRKLNKIIGQLKVRKNTLQEFLEE